MFKGTVKILITGHTGFKGSWLSVVLSELGHELYGFSDGYRDYDLYSKAFLSRLFVREHWSDIRNLEALEAAIRFTSPDVIFHLAAQSLVPKAYSDPLGTLYTNAGGTLNLMLAMARESPTSTLLNITTDKVYQNLTQPERRVSFTESDTLGGQEPYSISKVLAEQISYGFATALPHLRTTSLRAGNVVGGGDRGERRLIPDIWKSYVSGAPLIIRNSSSTRPWQHVLDCTTAYVVIAHRTRHSEDFEAWNVGPEKGSEVAVFDVVELAHSLLPELKIEYGKFEEDSFYETQNLSIDSKKLRHELGWVPVMTSREAILETLRFELSALEQENIFPLMRSKTIDHLNQSERIGVPILL